VDNFLRFIQQLRVYLTQAEQEKIWAKEAQRPSAVGNYLLVYALIARGLPKNNPPLLSQPAIAYSNYKNIRMSP